MIKTRTEEDSLGIKNIPEDALYGIQAMRAQENFPISGRMLSSEFISAYAILKKSAAAVNARLWKLDTNIAKEIWEVCDEIIAWKYTKEFIVDIYQAGAGTSTNMNLNEVITNRILEKRGEKKWSYDILSPNDIVNMSQSTNDSYPTAMRIALVQSSPKCIDALKLLQKSFENKAKEYKTAITSARTHLQDAVPITIGQEFQWYADTLKNLQDEFKRSIENLKILWIWGSAAGTGINTHPEYHREMIQEISRNTSENFKTSENLIESMQSQRQIADYMDCLARIATEISRIANDLRLLSSWPNTGIWEIELPPVQPGSSIMPGKVNPSILECVNMVCFEVLGGRHSVEHCIAWWQLNLNVFMPLMSHKCLEANHILANAIIMMAEKTIDWLKVNMGKCSMYAYESNGIFTALNPILGYHAVSWIVKKRQETWKPIKQLLEEETDLSTEDIEKILNPLTLSNIQNENI